MSFITLCQLRVSTLKHPAMNGLLRFSIGIACRAPLMVFLAALSSELPSGCSPGLNWICYSTSKGIISTASQTCTQSGSADIVFKGSFCPPQSGYYALWLSGSTTTYSGTLLSLNGTSVGTQNTKINLSLSSKLCYPLQSDIPQINSVTSTIYFQYYSGDAKIVTSNETSSCYSYFCQNSMSPPNCSPNATSAFTGPVPSFSTQIFAFFLIVAVFE